MRTPGLPDGNGGNFSFGKLAFPQPLEPSAQPWPGEGAGQALAGGGGNSSTPHTPPRATGTADGAGTGGDHMLMQTWGG